MFINTNGSPRNYASNLASLVKTLHKEDITTYNISQNFHYRNIEKLPPLAYIPSDLKSFHNQLTHSWNIYANNKKNPTVYPPTNVNPSCNSFTYKVFHWSPLQWTRILDSSPISTDFQMIHLISPSYANVTIMQTNAPQKLITTPQASFQETFLFMSKLLSYFYEKYTSITFKLSQDTDFMHHINTTNCTLGLHELPAIQEVIKPPGENRIMYTTSCILQRIARIQKLTWTEYTISFPTSRLRNIKQQTPRYLNSNTPEQTLTFQWPYINQTAFKLHIRVSHRRKNLPKIWWILPHTDSLLTYHKNHFVPINTRTTTYSYTLNNRHHYNKGGCIDNCKHKELQETVQRRNLPTTSWPLPQKNTQGLVPKRLYCLPQCGTIENHMKLFHEHVPSWWPPPVSDKCTSHSSNLTTLSERQKISFSNLQHLNPSLNNTIYTYETNTPIEFSGPLKERQYELSHIHGQIKNLTRKFTISWQQAYLQYKKLETTITESLLLHDDSLIHQSELLYYTESERELDRNTLKMSTSAYLANYKINEFKDNYYHLNKKFKQMQDYAEQIYSLKYMTIILQAIQNRNDLQPNVIYSHKFNNGFLQNKPIMRILPPPSQSTQITLRKNSHTKRTNKQQTPHSDNRPTTNIPTNLKSRQIKSQIVLISTRPALYTIPLQDVQTTQLTKVQTHTPLPYQTIKIILTNLMASFTHFINQAHFLYNAVHIVVSSRLQHANEMITKLCERG